MEHLLQHPTINVFGANDEEIDRLEMQFRSACGTQFATIGNDQKFVKCESTAERPEVFIEDSILHANGEQFETFFEPMTEFIGNAMCRDIKESSYMGTVTFEMIKQIERSSFADITNEIAKELNEIEEDEEEACICCSLAEQVEHSDFLDDFWGSLCCLVDHHYTDNLNMGRSHEHLITAITLIYRRLTLTPESNEKSQT